MKNSIEEIWKDISGYEGLYQISNLGRVKSLKRYVTKGKNFNQTILFNEKILKQSKNKAGYWVVTLCKESIIRPRLVHRLIAKEFIPNPENKPYINHINGIKSDYRILNLEWCTASENQIHSIKTGLRIMPKGEKHHNYGRRGPETFNYGKCRGIKNNKSKLVLDTSTGIFYDCLVDACNAKGIKYKITSNRICKNKSDLIYA